jgi:hypothetical protein
MIKSLSLNQIRTSVVTKVAGLSVLAVLAVGFFVLPLSATAKSSSTGTAQLFGGYYSCGAAMSHTVDIKEAVQYMLAPFLDHTAKLSGLKPSDFFDAVYKGQHVTGMLLTKTKAMVIVNGKPLNVTLTDGSGTTNSTKNK